MPDSLKTDSYIDNTDSSPIQEQPSVPPVVRTVPARSVDAAPAGTVANTYAVSPDTVSADTLVVENISTAVVADSITVETKTGFEGIPLPNTLNNGNWIGIALIFFVFLLTRSKQMIRDSVSALFALKERENLFASSTGYNIQNWLSVFLVAIVGFSLFVYDQAFNSLSEKIFISNFLLTALGVTVFFLFKYLSFAFFGNIFFDKATLRNWLKSYSTLFCVCGIVLILISALLLCNVNISAEILYIIGFIGIGITLILMLYKLIQIFFYKGYSIFYLLLYLCALEIMPVLVLVKALFVG